MLRVQKYHGCVPLHEPSNRDQWNGLSYQQYLYVLVFRAALLNRAEDLILERASLISSSQCSVRLLVVERSGSQGTGTGSAQ